MKNPAGTQGVNSRLILSIIWDLFFFHYLEISFLNLDSCRIFLSPFVFVDVKEDIDAPTECLLDWKTVNKQMPWGVIILLGGGFALADACKVKKPKPLS